MADVFISDIAEISEVDDSVEFVGDNGETSYSVPAPKLKKYTQQGISNPNLLDNWYFVNPVNQQGLTEYSGLSYGIDRWKSTLAVSKYALSEKGIVVSSGNFRHLHIFENAAELVGRKLTVSFLLSENTATTNLAIAEYVNGAQGSTKVVANNKATGCISSTFTASEGFEGIIIFNTSAFDGIAVITAVKLELGDIQTLAHQDADGNWVLNEIPNDAEQLARCQRHQLRIGYKKESTYVGALATGFAYNTTSIRFLIPTPVSMRTNPSVAFLNNATISVLTAKGDGASLNISAITTIAHENGILLVATVSGAIVNQTYALYLNSPAGIILDANL